VRIETAHTGTNRFEETQGVEGMSQNHRSGSVRLTAALVVLVLALSALALAGCGGTKESPGGPSGTGAPAGVKYADDTTRAQVVTALKGFGLSFDQNMLSITVGAGDTIVVQGPMTGPKVLGSKPASGTAVSTAYAQIVVKKDSAGAWSIVSTK
jgi:hypothetical protein